MYPTDPRYRSTRYRPAKNNVAARDRIPAYRYKINKMTSTGNAIPHAPRETSTNTATNSPSKSTMQEGGGGVWSEAG